MASSNQTVTVDTLNQCVFCLRPADSTISLDLESLSLTQVFSYVQPDWTTDDKIEYKFVHGNKVLGTPPVCSFCGFNLLNIKTLHLEAVEIEKRLKEVRGKLHLQVKTIRGRMTRKESSQLKAPGTVLFGELYADRYKGLVKSLRKNLLISRKVVTDTLSFLKQLQDGHETESVPLPATGQPLVTPSSAPTTTAATSGNPNAAIFTLVYENGAVGLRPLQNSPRGGGIRAPGASVAMAPQMVSSIPPALVIPPGILLGPRIPTVPVISLGPAVPPGSAIPPNPVVISTTLTRTSTSDASTVSLNYLPPTEQKRQMMIESNESLRTKKATSSSNPGISQTGERRPETLHKTKSQLEKRQDSIPPSLSSHAKDAEADEDCVTPYDGEGSIKSEVEEDEDVIELQDLMECKEEDPLWCESESTTDNSNSPETVATTRSKTPVRGRPRNLSPCLEKSAGVVTCEACSLKFPLEEMPDHMYDHVGVYACKCPNPNCKYTFVSRRSSGLELHLKNSLSVDGECWNFLSTSHPEFLDSSGKRLLLYCTKCAERFIQLTDFQTHLSRHEQAEKKKPFACPVSNCVERFALRQSVEFHLVKDHPFPKVTEKRVRQPRVDNPFPINDVNWMYVDLGQRWREQQSCEVCGKYYLATDMSHHMASHIGSEYVYKCPNRQCFFTFVSKWSAGYISHLRSAAKTNKTNACWKAACDDPSVTSWRYIKKTCDICGEILSSVLDAGEHFKEHERPEKNFSCPICGARFTVRQSVEFHLKVHTLLEATRVAKSVAKKFNETSSQKSKEESKEKSATDKCTLCKKDIQLDEMSQHLQNVHAFEEGKLIRCKQCTMVVINREELVNHLVRHTREGTGVLCDLCQEEEGNPERLVPFISGVVLKNHYFEKHGIGKKIVCEKDNCEFSTFSKFTMRNHVRVVHEGLVPKSFKKCFECSPPKVFPTSDELQSHNVRMHGAEPFKCRHCSKTFFTLKVKSKHEKFQHEEKERQRFVCDLCGSNLASRNYYIQHMKIMHAFPDAKRYKCDKCDKVAFKYLNTLKRHLFFEHGEGKNPTLNEVVCETCGLKVSSQSILEQHKRIHTGERPFQCEICGLRFRQKACWKAHMKCHARLGNSFRTPGTFDKAATEELRRQGIEPKRKRSRKK